MKKENSRGITLIALVVTIIVLLILSGITIAMLTGENALIRKTNQARELNALAEARERVQIVVYGSYNLKGKLDMAELEENLETDLGVTDVEATDGSDVANGVTFQFGDYDVEVDPIGNVVVTPTE